MRQMTRVLELMEEGYSIIEAKRIDREEQKNRTGINMTSLETQCGQ